MPFTECFENMQYPLCISSKQCVYDLINERFFEKRETCPHVFCRNLIIDRMLLQERERISESTTSRFGNDSESFCIYLDSFSLRDKGKPADDI